MTLSQYVAGCISRLSPVYDAGEARWLMRIIFEHLKGWSQTDYVMNRDLEISQELISLTEPILDRLMKNEPVQYILGETYWHGLRIKVAPGVLIPREETSELIDIITSRETGQDLHVMDVCTGSGCIAIALARALPFSQVTATDISEKALAIASENIRALKANVRTECRDALAGVDSPHETYDIIVSNPPYIGDSERSGMNANVLDYEPHIALFVTDDDPLKFYRAISENSFIWLKKGGRLYFEINPLHSKALKSILEMNGWTDVEIIRDIHGKERFAVAVKPL